MLRRLVNPVAKRKERIRRKHRTRYRQLRSHRANLHRIDARHLPGADAQRHAVAREQDGVELQIVADLSDRRILEQRLQHVERRRRAQAGRRFRAWVGAEKIAGRRGVPGHERHVARAVRR